MDSTALTGVLRETLARFDERGTPLTTSEVADALDLGRRSTYERLQRLVDHDRLDTKKVGASARVWWRPVGTTGGASGAGRASQDPLPGTEGPAERAFEALVDAVEEHAIFLLDPEGYVRTWNSGARAIKGYEADDIVDRHFSTFYTDEDVAEGVPERNLAAAAASGEVEDEGWRVRADGERFWAAVTLTAIRDEAGDLLGFAKVTRDMTERHRKEQELREQAEFTRNVLGTAPVGVVVLQDDGTFEVVNRRASELLGVRQDGSHDVGVKDVYDAAGDPLPPEERPYVRAFETGDPVRNAHLAVGTDDGGRRWLSTNVEPLAGPDGDVDRVLVTLKDITRLREQNQRLRRQRDDLEDELGDVFGRVDDAFLGVDDDWRLTYANDTAADLLGVPVGDLLGSTVWNALPEVAEGDPRAAAERAVETQESTELAFHSEMLDAWFEARIYPSENGLSVYFRDVTEDKRREAELEQYERIVETIDDGVYVLDCDGTFNMVNEAFASVTGYDREELVGSRAERVFSDELVADANDKQAALESGRLDVAVQEEQLHRADGTSIVVETRFDTFDFDDGGTGRVGVVRDIDDRVERERTLEEYRRRYDTLVDLFPNGAVTLVDRDLTYVTFGGTLMRDYDLSRADIEGKPVREAMPDELAAAVAPGYERALEGESVRFEAPVGDDHYRFHYVPVRDDDGEVFAAMGISQNVTESKRYEQRLEALNAATSDLQSAESAEAVGEILTETVSGTFDVPGVVLYTPDDRGDRLAPVAHSPAPEFWLSDPPTMPVDDGSITGLAYGDGEARYVPDVTESSHLWSDPADTRIRTGMFLPLGDRGILVAGSGDVDAFEPNTRQLLQLLTANAREALARVEREGELRRRVRQQEVITDLGRRALASDDVDALIDEATAAVADVLDADCAGALALDDEVLTLTSGVGWCREAVGSATVPADGPSQAAYALSADGPVVAGDLRTEERFDGSDLATDHDVQSGVSVVVGPPAEPWGVLAAHHTDPRRFSEHDVRFVQSVATTLASAVERRRTERALRQQREQLAALNGLNQVVQDIIDAVVDRSTRPQIEAAVCEGLADADAFSFAWIGEVVGASGTVELRTEAGVEGYLDDVTISVDPDDERSQGPTGRALSTGEVHVTQNVANDDRHAPWQEHVEGYGFSSSAAIPIVHEGTVYGALNVYADRPGAFAAAERRLLGQLGEVVGHAIAAVERKRALMSDEVVELEFRVQDVFETLDVDAGTDGRITFDQTVPTGDGTYLVYGTATEDVRPVVDSTVAALSHWESVDDLSRQDGVHRFELRMSEPPVISAVATRGGYVEEATIEDGDYHMAIHLPPTVDVRSVTDAVTAAYPRAELLAQRQLSRPADSAAWTDRLLREELTDRQRTALEAAYHAGFFEWPRESDGSDVAASLDVASPTFHQHLRKAERKVFDTVLSGPPDPRS